MMNLMVWSCIMLNILRSEANSVPIDPHAMHDLYGYDCGMPGVSTTSINLVEVEPCTMPNGKEPLNRPYIQIIEAQHFSKVLVSSCRVLKTYSIYRCGMHSHQMLLAGPYLNVPQRISVSDCQEMIKHGYWQTHQGKTITDIKINVTYQFSTTEDGTLAPDGSCSGTTIVLDGAEYHYAFTQANYNLLVEQYMGDIDIDRNIIHLKDSLICVHNEGSCYDSLVGVSYWTPFISDCNNLIPHLLYEGQSEMIEIKDGPSLIRVNQDKFMFISLIEKTSRICGRTVYTTDYIDILVLVTSVYNPKLPIRKGHGYRVNPVLYANAKISYLHYQLIDDINLILQDVYYQLCQLERRVLENTLNIVRLSNHHTAQVSGIGGRGTIINVQGEVAYITKCPLRQVQLREVDTCYEGIPIQYNGTMGFMLPISRLIVSNVPQEECSMVSPLLFHIGLEWIAMTPKFIKVAPPQTLHPKITQKHELHYIKDFSSGGIYSEQDIKQFYDNLAFPAEREAIINHMTKSLKDNSPMQYNIMNTLSADGWATIAKNRMLHFWGYFITFGEFISGLLGMYFLYLLITKTFSGILRICALKKQGLSGMKLLSAISSSATLFLLNKNPKPVEDDAISLHGIHK